MESLGISLAEIIAFAKLHYLIAGGWLVCLGYIIWLQINIIVDGIRFIDFNNATTMVNHDGATFVDIRSKEDFSKEHIHGSLDVLASDILEGMHTRIEKYKKHGIIVVSQNNDDTQSYNCAKVLKKAGYKNTFLLTGGILELKNNNIPLTRK
jgi:rhodanese-related sulfurtransferase